MVNYKEDLQQRKRARGANPEKEEIRSSRQAHHASRTHPLSGVSKETATVCHDFRSHDHYPQASDSTCCECYKHCPSGTALHRPVHSIARKGENGQRYATPATAAGECEETKDSDRASYS